ncbi:hypothetical protein Tco_0705121 [Tanacetum coccineum]|uniref:Uncharacterized protein n=1 Tax=Tanacetum coccineum TaxID=301880 RepID=A0ABQ4Y5M2_9ASTR
MAQQQEQQIIPTDQLVSTRYQSIRRCNNYAVLHNIPCPVECKIVGLIMIDHALSLLSLQQQMFQLFTYNNFRRQSAKSDILKTLFILRVVNRVHVDYATLIWWDFLHCIQHKKYQIQYPRFTKLIIAYSIKKFPSIPPRLEEDYHSIKDDILLYKEYMKMFVGVDVPAIHPQPVKSTQGTNRTPSAYRTPISTTITGDVVQNKQNRKQTVDETILPKPSLKIRVKQFQSSITPIPTPTYDDDDSGNKIEPGSHKEHPEIVDDGDENEKEKKDDKNDDDVNDDHTNHTLDETHEMGSLGTRNEKMQTPIPSHLRSLRTDLSSKKNLS